MKDLSYKGYSKIPVQTSVVPDGDEISLANMRDSGTNPTATMYANSTNVGVDISNTAGRAISSRSAVGFAFITDANWRLILRAWR